MKLSQLFSRGTGAPIVLGLGAALLCSAGFLRSQDEAASNDWPRSYSVDDDDVIIYQPKVEKWDQKYVEARFAVGIKGKNDEQPVYGSFLARGETLADIETRLVSIFNITEDDFKFPDAGKRLEHFKRDIAAMTPDQPLSVPMDQLVASVASDDAVGQDTVTTDTDSNAPRVIVSYTPTLLLAFDGPPIFRPISGSGLESAVNTPATVLRPAGQEAPLYVMTNEGRWLTAESLEGQWESSPAPAGIKKIPADHPVAVAIQNAGVPSGDADAPDIITTSKPAELIQLKGKPSYKQIGDSALVRVSNTDAPLFYHFDEGSFYVLISGRWFKAKELKGPWVYVAQNDLPGEFAEIPADGPSADVRASVAGTPEAEEAVVEAQVPTKAQVSLTEQPELEVQYDGEPVFEDVPGTECAYAVNTNYEVLRVDKRYYCCRDGVWFVAEKPFGVKWRLVTVLPRAILALPPSCPLYHLRFCTIDSFTDDDVTYSCTGGYWGTYIDPVSHVCVYGTGHYYAPYVSAVYYAGYPWTYGFGCRWWRHHGFVYEGRHVAHSAWNPHFVKKDHNMALWRAGAERWGGRVDKGAWRPAVHSFAPFHTWGNKVVVPHKELVASATRGHQPPKVDGPKPHVVFHGKPTQQHLVVFEKNLRVGSHGEIVRNHGKVLERRETGKWVAHPYDPKLEKRTPVLTHAKLDEPAKKKAPVVTRALEVRPTETALDRRGREIVVPRPDLSKREKQVLSDRQVLGEKRIEEKRFVEKAPEHLERRVIKSDDIPRAKADPVITKGDNPPVERRVIRIDDTPVIKREPKVIVEKRVEERRIEDRRPEQKVIITSDDTLRERVRSVPRFDAVPSETKVMTRDVETRTVIRSEPVVIQPQPQPQPQPQVIIQPRVEPRQVTREVRVERHDNNNSGNNSGSGSGNRGGDSGRGNGGRSNDNNKNGRN
jgi:hypothetical protein